MNDVLTPTTQERQLSMLYRLLAPLLAAGVLFAGLVLTLFTGHPIGGWLAVTAFILASILIGYPRRFLFVFFGLVLLQPSLQILHPHWLLQLSDKLLALLLFLVVSVNFIKDRTPRQDIVRFNRLLLLFFGLAITSAAVNRVPIIQVLRFFLTYGTFIPAFYATYHFLRPDAQDARKAIVVIGLSFGLQIVLNLGWLVGINPLPNPAAMVTKVDFSIGTLGAQNIIAYFSTAMLFLLFALFNNLRGLKQMFVTAICSFVALIQLVFTFTFHVFPPMAILLILQNFFYQNTLRRKIIMVSLACMLVVGFIYAKSNPYLLRSFNFNADEQMTFTIFERRWADMWRGPKGQAYYNIFVHSRNDMPFWLLGGGPGNFASGIGRVHRSELAEKYVNYIYFTHSGRMERSSGSITQHVTTGISAIYSEFGPFGILLFFGLHGLALVHVFRLLKKNAYRSKARKLLAEAFIPTMMLYMSLNLISDFLSSTFLQVGVWMWAGLIWKTEVPLSANSPSKDDHPDTIYKY